MKTVLVRYKEYLKDSHPLLDDGGWVEKSKIIKVADLTELNDSFKNIIDVKILEKI